MSTLRRAFALLALALVAAPLLASAPLFDPDEGLHAAIAQEMVQRGDYVTPTFLGEPFLDKPILFFWAEAASLRLFGDREAAIRIPPLLFGLLGMLAVAGLGRALFGESAGLVAGIAYGTMLLPLGVSEVAVHDIGLVPFMVVACWCLLACVPGPAGTVPPRRILLLGVVMGISLGLSILTKGLVGVVFTGIFGACLAAHRPPAIPRLVLALTIGGLVALAVAAPWYVAMERAHPGYLHYYFVERHLQGYLTSTQRHAGRPFWYYVPIVIGGALPWTAYLVGAARSARGGRLRLVLWGWFAIGLLFLSIGESKLVTYALPLFPALAILVGEYVATSRPRGAFLVHVVALALLPPLGLIAIGWKYGSVHAPTLIAVVLFSLLTLEAGRRASRSTIEYGLVVWTVGMSICALAGMMAVAPRAADWMTSREFAAALNRDGVLPPRVSVLDERIGSLVFYLDPPLRAEASRRRLDDATFSDAIALARVDPPDAVLAVRNTQLSHFNRLFPSPPVPYAIAGTFSLFRAGALRQAMKMR
jgi:4-amino-4-deoxy-L-arabinose transferase-like glycosyltransferase